MKKTETTSNSQNLLEFEETQPSQTQHSIFFSQANSSEKHSKNGIRNWRDILV